jgi:hypothetical protein
MADMPHHLHERSNFFATTELSTMRRGHQERRTCFIIERHWPNGLPDGLQIQQRNRLICAAFRSEGFDPPSDRQLQRMDKKGVLGASDMSDGFAP